MKTRKLAAKALSVAVIATTVSGYAMAGDHSITADPSFVPWATCNYKVENSTLATPGSANGGCASGGDVKISFSGKTKGWSYSFDIDPSEAPIDGTTGILNSGDMQGSVKLSRDLGNGLTLHLGDVGSGSQDKNGAGHWEGATHDLLSSVGGGAQLGYAKGNLSATFSYGGNSARGDNGGSNIAFGGNMKFGKFDVGASYHMRSPSDRSKKVADANSGGKFQGQSNTGMTFGVGGSFGNYNFAADYVSANTKVITAAGSTDEDETKATGMGVHVWAGAGVWRPGLSYATTTKEFTKHNNTGQSYKRKGTKMAAGVAWHPAGEDGYVRFLYTSVADDQCAATPCGDPIGTGTNTTEYTKMELKVGTSVTIL